MIQRISIIFASLFLAVTTTYATSSANINANNGFYVGGAVDIASYEAVSGSAFSSNFITVGGYFRPFMGYRFNNYLAAEGGYNSIVNDSHSGNATYGPDHYRLYAFDLAAKFIYPFEMGISIFGKLGAGLAHQDVYNQTFAGGPVSANTDSNGVLPLVGAGVSYNFTKKIATELSYEHMFKSGNIGAINTLGIGVSYTFG